MADLLVRYGVSHHLEQLIDHSQERLILISPFLRTNDRIRQLLQEKSHMNIPIDVVYGKKKELEPDEEKWLTSMRSHIRLGFYQNLHSKCYLNEKEAIVTSMNLYDFSQRNNHEMGILLEVDKDRELYGRVLKEAERVVDLGGGKPRIEGIEVARPANNGGLSTATAVCFCIRCGRGMTEPYLKLAFCPSCHREWEKEGKDIHKPEKHCHVCRTQYGNITMADFACSTECRKKYRDLVGAPSVAVGSVNQ